MKIKTARALRVDPEFSLEDFRSENVIRGLRAEHLTAARAVADAAGAEGRTALLASEQRAFDEHIAEVDALDLLLREQQAAHEGLYRNNPLARSGNGGAAGNGRQEFRVGQPLAPEQRMTDYVRSRGLVREEERDLSFGRYVRGLVTGNWQGADGERRALVEGTASAGGHLVPTTLSAQIIDRARNQTRVLQAGARIVPMENQNLKMARITGDPTAAWHTELAAISASDMTFDFVELRAKALASRVLISRELMEDAQGVDDEVMKAFAEQFGLTVDLAALYGTGTAPEPLGVKNHPSVVKTPLDVNGRIPTYDDLIDAAFRVRGANFDPTAQIMSNRTGQTIGKFKGTDGHYIDTPPALDGVQRLTTVQVPNTLTVGTSTDTTDVFTADWSELLIGVRTSLEITLLRERSMDVGAYELMAWWRGDIAVARPAAFDVMTGVRA